MIKTRGYSTKECHHCTWWHSRLRGSPCGASSCARSPLAAQGMQLAHVGRGLRSIHSTREIHQWHGHFRQKPRLCNLQTLEEKLSLFPISSWVFRGKKKKLSILFPFTPNFPAKKMKPFFITSIMPSPDLCMGPKQWRKPGFIKALSKHYPLS